ncbi:MAG: hypothetical protein R3E64_04030 [Halioglobus sp.]
MSRRTGGLYRKDESGKEVLVHRSQPRGTEVPAKKTTAPKATAKSPPASKAQTTTTGGEAS